MRILQVNDLPLSAGSGAEVALSRLVEGLRAAGDTVEVFAGEVSHHGAAKVLDGWDPWARRAVARRAERFRPDVVHHHNVLRELSASVLGVPHGVPTVLTVQDFRLLGAADDTGRAALDRLQQAKSLFDRAAAKRRVDLVVGVSAPLAERLRSSGFRRVIHLPNFADGPRAGATRPEPPSQSSDVVFAGRITRDKGVFELAAAFHAVASRYPSSRLVIAGDGPERSALERVLVDLLPGRYELLGRVAPEQVAQLFASARLVAIPSLPARRPEGLPLVAVEAALAGRPIVAGDDPGLRSFIDDTGGGTIVAVTDPDALIAALDRFLGDPDSADTVGAAGRAAALAGYTTAAVVARLREAYRSLLPA